VSGGVRCGADVYARPWDQIAAGRLAVTIEAVAIGTVPIGTVPIGAAA
jgi:hypothetical protein